MMAKVQMHLALGWNYSNCNSNNSCFVCYSMSREAASGQMCGADVFLRSCSNEGSVSLFKVLLCFSPVIRTLFSRQPLNVRWKQICTNMYFVSTFSFIFTELSIFITHKCVCSGLPY